MSIKHECVFITKAQIVKICFFQAADSGPQTVEDFGAEGVAEAPREEEEGEVAEEALEQGRRSWLSHTDMKVFITTVSNYLCLNPVGA